MSDTKFRLVIPSATEHLNEVRKFVAQHALGAGLMERAVEECQLAVDEACTNIIKHAYEGQSDCQVEIRVTVERGRLTVRILDNGKAFDQSTYKKPNLKAFMRQGKRGGFGVSIMRRLMDQVEYRSNQGMNETFLVKNRRRQRSAAGAKPK